MDQEIREGLLQAGVDVDGAISRLMDNEGLYLRVLKKFKEDKTFGMLKDGIAAGDVSMTFEGAHALKGVAGNLGMLKVFDAVVPIVETARAGSMDGVEEAFGTLEACYTAVMDVVQKME